MRVYNIYSINNKPEKIIKTVKEGISLLGFVIGPILFIFYRMWKQFLIYIALLFVSYSLLLSSIITEEFYKLCYITIYAYIGFDFYNLYEQHLLSKGYLFKARVVAYNKLDAEEKLIEKKLI